MKDFTTFFDRKKRDNGECFYSLHESAPEWLYSAIRDAHAGSLPNDWVYNIAHSFLYDYARLNWDEDICHEWCDNQVDVYTSDLYAWSAAFCNSELFAIGEETLGELGAGQSLGVGGCEKTLRVVQFGAIEHIMWTMFRAVDLNEEKAERGEE